MKKYKKKPSKLLQIRLSEKEHEDVIACISKYGVTHREWIMTVINSLGNTSMIKDGSFWESWKDYAYANSDKWDKQVDEDSVCEECGVGYFSPSKNSVDYHKLERHHYAGYIGENAFKVKILCRKCHVKQPRSIDKIIRK